MERIDSARIIVAQDGDCIGKIETCCRDCFNFDGVCISDREKVGNTNMTDDILARAKAYIKAYETMGEPTQAWELDCYELMRMPEESRKVYLEAIELMKEHKCSDKEWKLGIDLLKTLGWKEISQEDGGRFIITLIKAEKGTTLFVRCLPGRALDGLLTAGKEYKVVCTDDYEEKYSVRLDDELITWVEQARFVISRRAAS